MLKYAVCLFVLFAAVKANEKMISKGSWRIIDIQKCEDDESYDFKFNVTKYKISRIEDAYDGYFSLNRDLDDSYSIYIEISKMTDGGWKDYSVMKDDCFICFLKKYAEDVIIQLLAVLLPELEIKDFPLFKGEYYLLRYIFNYCGLPDEGVLGLFKAKALIKDKYHVPVGCIILIVEFREETDDCEGKKEEESE